MTVRDLLEKSLRLAGVLADGESADGDMINEALENFQMFADSWASELELEAPFYSSSDTYALTGGVANYAVGLSLAIDTIPPKDIENLYVTYNSTRFPVQKLDIEQFNLQSATSSTSDIPMYFNYQYQSSGRGLLRFYPAPATSLDFTMLYRENGLLDDASIALSDSISLQQGMQRALMYNFALDLISQYGTTLDPMIVKIADDTKSQMKRLNTKAVKMGSDVSGLIEAKSFDILKG